MFSKLVILSSVLAIACALPMDQATDVNRCTKGQPFPLEVRILNCVKPPCNVVRGSSMLFEIDFVNNFTTTSLRTQVRATTLGITVPYILPDEVADVCSNLMHYAYCPLDPTEDVTYLFDFFVQDTYPEIPVKIEISLINQDKDVVTCFSCPIKVISGNTGSGRS